MRFRRNIRTVFVTVFVAIGAVLFLMPTVLTISNSFMASSEISANYGAMYSNMTNTEKTYIAEDVNLKFIPDKVTVDQYRAVLITSSDYLVKFWNSVRLTLPITLFQMLVAVLTSYGFARYPSKLKGIIFFAYIILMIMPYQVTLVPNFLVAKRFGLQNTRSATILPAIFSPFSIYLLTKVMRRIPVSYIEAAKLDGANELQILMKIYAPLCKNALIAIGLLIFIDYWNMVEQPLILMSSDEAKAMQPLSVFLAQINTQDIGLAFAVGVVYMIPSLLLFLYFEDSLVDGIVSSGGIKG